MLSKIKAIQGPPASLRSQSNSNKLSSNNRAASRSSSISDNEDDGIEDTGLVLDLNNDSNNNNSINFNNNNYHKESSKKDERELLDIVEVSRKRRLSKSSADSLAGFIRWSFTHISDNNNLSSLQSLNLTKNYIKQESLEGNDEDMLDEQEQADGDRQSPMMGADWARDSDRHIFQLPEQLLKQQHNLNSSAANLALFKAATSDTNNSGGLNLSSLLGNHERALKRQRTQAYSPERGSPIKSFTSSNQYHQRKSSVSHLGNVVERLHQQQQQQQQQQLSLQHQEEQQQQESNSGLSYHLQQFLQQQISLEDLCSSVGLDDGNQLVLAAAIHRALVDSSGSSNQPSQSGAAQQLDSKSIASSTGSGNSSSLNLSSSASSSTGNNTSGATNLSQVLNNTSCANLNLIDSARNVTQQRRAYNTRAALHHGLTGSSATNSIGKNNHSSVSSSSSSAAVAAAAAASMNNTRAQQQRHAQAAAALSALAASAGNSSSISGHLHQQHNRATSSTTGSHQQHHSMTAPIVDFECDTCGSSFDDRHRLMQHQSIHLELKKDWFTETPVDEVMKIFNRRRGEFLCNTCNLRFEATFDYDKHNHSVHGQRPYCCQFCGNGTRTFRFWRQYLNHLYDHRYIFSCTIDDCDFTVNRRDSLRFHIFRFHLNCQLPQNQQHQLAVNGGRQTGNQLKNNNMLMGDSKWANLDEDDGEDNDMIGE